MSYFDPEDRKARNERLHQFAHDLRNKLDGLHQAYKHGASGPRDPDLDAMAERSYFGAAAAIEDLLIEMGVPLDPVGVRLTTIDLLPTLKHAAEGQAFRLGKKEQHIRILPFAPVSISADEHLLDQLLEAMLSNAIKFSPLGAEIQVAVHVTGHTATIAVVDPGTGLGAKDLERVFRRFAILGSRTTHGEAQNRGTLARAIRWAAAQGGDLQLESAGEGMGCSCLLRLPTAGGRNPIPTG